MQVDEAKTPETRQTKAKLTAGPLAHIEEHDDFVKALAEEEKKFITVNENKRAAQFRNYMDGARQIRSCPPHDRVM